MLKKNFETRIRKFVYVLVLPGLLLLDGCSYDKYKLRDQVILVFQNQDQEKSFIRKRASIKYIDDNLIPHEFNPSAYGRYKYVVATSRKHIDIAYQDVITRTTKHFLFKKGDSVLIKLEGKWPVARILNRKAGKYESNFEKNIHQDFYNDKPPALEDYYFYWHRVNNDISPISGSVISEELQFLKEKALRELEQESFYIDSLEKSEIIDSEIANFYRQKNQFEKDKLKLFDEDKINFSHKNKLESIVSKINSVPTDSTSQMALYTFHDDFTTLYYHNYLSKKINEEDLDSITTLDVYSTPFGKSLLFKQLDQLLLSYSVKQGKELLASCSDDTLPEYWSDYFYSKYNLDQHFATNWYISNDRKSIINFGDILKENQGNLLYVDFWASWCRPSIKEMPALKKLLADYETSPFNVVHISVDKNNEKWEWAENEYLGFNLWNSYILDNRDLQIIRKTFVMDSVPRYLLFDPKRNLIHGNAPKPSSKEIRVLLNTYLKNTGQLQNEKYMVEGEGVEVIENN